MLNIISLDKVYTNEYTLYGGENMVKTITLKKLRPGLPEVIKGIDTKLERYIVMKRGRPVAIMLGPDDYESLLETIEILSDKEAVKRIIKAKKEIAENKIISLEDLRNRIEKANA
ncbi:MAG: type II toxin-antitoxin system Phd/YefM family antitoxin [Candidatus Omnitrophica bacterium]|nr:type II toxin-antitoxin system Phd/YefM family antitoxin [Candidatus Omnitrophota bacterium]